MCFASSRCGLLRLTFAIRSVMSASGMALARPRRCEHLFFTGNPSVGKTTLVIETIRAVLSSSALEGKDVRVRGFYTQECRTRNGERIGFDIVHFPTEGIKAPATGAGGESSSRALDLDELVGRSPLARSGGGGSSRRGGGGSPSVGKYAVDVESIRTVAVPAIAVPPADEPGATLIALDEVGKMEMLCPEFLPAVTRTLDSFAAETTGGTRLRGMVIGTIPTPRYGHVIQAVEDIRARPDVTVVYVTKQNRDDLREEVKKVVLSKLEADVSTGGGGESSSSVGGSFSTALKEYLYDRPIGASSMKEKQPAASGRRIKDETAGASLRSAQQTNAAALKPCGPLVHDKVKPKVLLLGETASPQPETRGMEYSERSMWTVLAGIWGEPVPLPTGGGMTQEAFAELRERVLGSGVAIWDVLSDVHVRTGAKSRARGGGKKRGRTAAQSGQPPSSSSGGAGDNPNSVEEFLQEHESIEVLAFIGAKARKTFEAHFATVEGGGAGDSSVTTLAGREIELMVLPSSSRTNSRMSIVEKSRVWREAFAKFCPDCRH